MANPLTASTVSRLRLYLDTADAIAWEQWHSTGIFYGVTTNPLLLERSHIPCTLAALTRLTEIALGLGMQEIQLQTWGDSPEAMVERGLSLAAIHPAVVVKVPITRAGTEAAAQLAAAGVRVTLTAVYEVYQMLIAAALGAAYTAPYLGRITDLGRDGLAELAQMQRVLQGVGSPTRILVASIRSVEDLAYLAAQGLDTFTFSSAIATALFQVDPTIAATADFARAARSMG
jgi:transaldolase